MGKLTTAALIFLAGVAIASCGREDSPRLEPLGAAPDWTMATHEGATLSSTDLRGKAYVVNFIWTNCRDTCPTLSLQMALLQQRLKAEGLLGDEVVLVSFSFDPERDTPERLRRYAEIFRAEPGGWFFLTGPADETFRVITRGFGVFYQQVFAEDGGDDRSNLADEVPRPEESKEGVTLSEVIGADDVGQFLDIDYAVDFSHQNAFVLVDGQGQIRKYYVGVFIDVDQVTKEVQALR